MERYSCDKDGNDLPFPMAPAAAAGRTGETKQGLTGFDDGCLRGRLGRTRFGENELNMAAAEKSREIQSNQTAFQTGSHTPIHVFSVDT